MTGSNVVLIGMMGSGKSTVGKMVADQTGREFIDLDQVIVDKSEREIADIFAEEGEENFRQLETESLRELRSATHAVIATGGGVVTRAENRRILRELGVVFWLDAPPDELLDRIGDDESRPMLHGGDPFKRLVGLLAERREYYADASNVHLDTSELTPAETAARIIREIGAAGVDEPSEELFATIIAIDGPVGSGKSALARSLAARLNYTHVDTGSMYRCVALEARQREVALDDAPGLTVVAHSIDIRFRESDGNAQRVLLNGEDVTEAIRAPEISKAASAVADVPTVRKELVELQRQLALRGRSVLEGRDISTVVVPEAHWKLYLTASLEERLDRRLKQYRSQGNPVNDAQVRRDIVTRDERDRTRAQGALRLAPDATIVDTTGLPLEEVVETLAALIACP